MWVDEKRNPKAAEGYIRGGGQPATNLFGQTPLSSAGIGIAASNSPPPIHLGSNRRTKGSKQSKKILSFSYFRLLIILLLLDPPAIVESDQALYQNMGPLRQGRSGFRTGCLKNVLIAMIFTAFACVESRNSERRSQHRRYRRQFDTSNASQIDLNITVPYIFQARLYPYGHNQEDQLAQSEVQALALQTPLTFLEKNYETIYIHRDGFVTFTPDFGLQNPTKLPIPDSQIISVFWQRSHDMRVFFRESTDPNILGLAHSEVNIQYRYGSDFVVKSVIVITWEEGRSEKDSDAKAKNDNVFQIALILGENACFAHIVYSRLRLNGDNKPVAGLSGGSGENAYTFSLPSSGTAEALQFIEKSNIGIPGEWLFRIDEERIYLCGAGFQGLECVDSCGPSQWYLDCSRICHCVDGNECNKETGECPDGKCNPGWEGSPTYIDECAEANIECPNEQPDCVNTPGAYLCLCFEYDNATNTCKGSKPSSPTENIPVPVMPLVPLLVPSTSPRPTSRRIATSGVVTSDTDMPKPPAKLDISHFVGTIPASSFVPSEPLKISTLSPMTIRVSL
ncbi:nidogen-like domain-containing protein [Ditylenchus destructor]|nr:nidogen-like domain-containing protein [Ditylenchus destructor]